MDRLLRATPELIMRAKMFDLIDEVIKDKKTSIFYPVAYDTSGRMRIDIDDTHTILFEISGYKKIDGDRNHERMWMITFMAWDKNHSMYGETSIEVSGCDKRLDRIFSKIKKNYAEQEFDKIYNKFVTNKKEKK